VSEHWPKALSTSADPPSRSNDTDPANNHQPQP
jgi:hypothetical protein